MQMCPPGGTSEKTPKSQPQGYGCPHSTQRSKMGKKKKSEEKSVWKFSLEKIAPCNWNLGRGSSRGLLRKCNVCLCVCVLSHFSCVWLFATLWTSVCQAPRTPGNPAKCDCCRLFVLGVGGACWTRVWLLPENSKEREMEWITALAA